MLLLGIAQPFLGVHFTLAGALRQKSLVALAGSGKGLWGRHSTRTLRRLREEWDR